MTLLSYFSIFLPPNQILIRVFLEDPLSKFLTLYYQKKDGSLESKTTKSSSSIFSFYLCDLDPGTSYRYFILDQIGYFKTLPCQGKNVKFNMGSCFGYAYQSFTQDSPENGIYPSDKVNFNLLMGDQIYADYYFGDPNSKLLLVRPALN